jgi:ferredoxin
MKIKVKINDKLCIGSGSCVVIASENFEINDEGKAELKPSEHAKTKGMEMVFDVTDAKKKRLLEAAMSCPAQAISIVDENGKKIY